MQLTFLPKNLLYTALLFLTEVFIALYINDAFIRPYGGDILVVLLVYYFLKTFIKTNPNLASLQAITLMLHLCFLLAFLVIIVRFTRDFLFYKHPFQLAFNRRKAPLIVSFSLNLSVVTEFQPFVHRLRVPASP